MKITVLLCAFLFVSSAYSEERRIALVFGNSNYQYIGSLKNAAKDAQDITAKLTELGFEVFSGINLTRRQMKEKVKAFEKSIRAQDANNTVALFFYAGHGLEVDGKNYIVPINAEMEEQNDVEDEGILLTSITRRMERSRSRLNIIILDACRNNPLPRGDRALGENGWSTKLETSAVGTFIAFGTSPGKTAADSDGNGQNGLFTKHILRFIGEEGLTLEQVFKKVRDGVYNDSHKKQKTWQNNSTTGDFFFKPGKQQVLTTEIVIEKRPTWLYPALGATVLLMLLLLMLYMKQRSRIKWAESVILSKELGKDKKDLYKEMQRSRLMQNEVVGYLKDLNTNAILRIFKSDDEITIGREKPSDIIIQDDVVSSRHCKIGYDPSSKSFWINDLDSSNGVWLNADNQVTPRQKQRLKNGQVFYISNQNHPLILVKNK